MRLPISRARSRALALLAGLALVASGFVSSQVAVADTAPIDPALPATVSSDALPTAQANGIVWSQAIAGNTVYAGGAFTTAQPPGAAAGVGTVARYNILSYNLTTGQLNPFAPNVNGAIQELAVSPDGTRLYIVGDFTKVNGITRNRIAAFDTATGALITSFNPGTNARVSTVVATDTTVYFGGSFSSAGTASRPGGLAAALASTGAVLPWAPVAAGGRAIAITVNPAGTKVVIGGSFTTMNGSGNPGYGLAAVDGTTGANVTWKVNSIVRDAGPNSAIYSLYSDGTYVYGSGYHFGSGGNLEGAFKATWTDGTLVTIEDCAGDTYSVYATASVVYVAGHPHNCANVPNGWPQTNPWTYFRGIAFTNFARGTLPRGNFSGKPVMELLNWYPTFNTGNVSGANQGPWSVTGNGQYVVYGGEFTTVNGTRQQGLVRFAIPTIAPNDDGPRLSGASWVPTASQVTGSSARINWPANYDRDNRTLTYKVLRNNVVVGTVTADSSPYKLPAQTFVNTGLAAGTTYTFSIRAEDAWGNAAVSNNVTVTTTGAPPPPPPPPPPGNSVGQDNFERVVTNGLGLADIGGAWTLGSAATNFQVSSGTGRFAAPIGGAISAYLPGVSGVNLDTTVTVTPTGSITGGGVYISAIGRLTGANEYSARVKIYPDNTAQLQILRGSTTVQTVNLTGLAYTPGAAIVLRIKVTGTSPTTIEAKAWKVGQTEPAAWQASITDSTAGFQSAGSIGLRIYVSGSSTAGLSAWFDNLKVIVP